MDSGSLKIEFFGRVGNHSQYERITLPSAMRETSMRRTSRVKELNLGSRGQRKKQVRISSNLLKNGTKDIGLQFLEDEKMSTDTDSVTSSILPMSVLKSDSDKVRNLKSSIDMDDSTRAGLKDRMMKEMKELTLSFAEKARAIVNSYNEDIRQQGDETAQIRKEGCALLKNKIIYIPNSEFENMRKQGPVKPKVNESGLFVGSDNFDKLLYLAKMSEKYVPLEFVRRRERERESANKARQRASNQNLDEEIQTARTITEFFPYITMDDARVCLACHSGDLVKVMNWLASFKDNTPALRQEIRMRREMGIGPKPIGKKKLGILNLENDNEKLTLPMFARTTTVAIPPSIAVQIVELSDDNQNVTIQLLRDRNKITLSSLLRMTIPLESLLSVKWYFANQEKIRKTLKERSLHITYNVDEQTGDMLPITLRPGVPFDEYTLNWDNRSRKLNSVTHQEDGEVEFVPIETESHIYDDEPIEIYSQIIDDNTLNIVFFTITDTREEIRVEGTNLTHTSKGVSDFLDAFKSDAGGNNLDYRIIVKESAVQAVLGASKHAVSEESQRQNFVEYLVPEPGSYVTVDDGVLKIGRIHSIPTGMIVTNKLEGVEKIPLQYEKRPGPEEFSRHAADLGGFVDIDILLDGDRLIYEHPVREAWHVCELTEADAKEINRLESMIEEAEAKKLKDGDIYEQKIDELSEWLQTQDSKGPNFFPTAQSLLAEIRKLAASDDVKERGLATKKNRNLVNSFVRELRLLKLGV